MNRRTLTVLFSAAALLGSVAASSFAASPLQIEVYNPGEKGIFPVSSEIVSGKKEVVLIDAQFQRNDAQALVEKIKATGKKLTTVYISHSDPDYYFGLDVIRAAFPEAKIVATAPTVAAIKATMEGKLAYWGPILKENAPAKLVLPAVLKGDELRVDGQPLKIKGLQGPTPERSYVWVPSLKTVAGGIPVLSGIHVWVADTQTRESRQQWLDTLRDIEALKPTTVIPGHYIGPLPKGTQAVQFTANYLKTFEAEASKAKNSAELIQAMKAAYPNLAEVSSLELSAKVIKGEMQWPAPAPYPAIGKKVEVNFDGTIFQLTFADERKMSFIGTAGSFKGVSDTVDYVAQEIRPQIYMVYWHEPKTGANVVHIQDWEKGTVLTNIAQPNGQFLHMKGSLRMLDAQ